MYQVFDCGKPADCNHSKVDKSWSKSTFDTYEEAVEYAQNWLGIYGGMELLLNTPVDYNMGATIEIREVGDN